MSVDRFHLVVTNHNRLESFVDNFQRIQGFQPALDRVYIFDCSSANVWQNELTVAHRLTAHGLTWGANLFFIRRRNWGDNWGGMLDYFRLVQAGRIAPPTYVAFMQEHFLDEQRYVKEDTLPANAMFDLTCIAAKFEHNPAIGCGFYSRYGIRVVASNPVADRRREFYGDGDMLLPNSVRRGFLVDGGNYVTRPQLYLQWFAAHKTDLQTGDGSYPFCIVWESRMGQILYDQKIIWADLMRDVEYRTVNAVDEIERARGEKISKLWYDNRVWFYFYGRDQMRYPPTPFLSVLKYFVRYYAWRWLFHARDTRLIFLQPGLARHSSRSA